MRVLALVTDAFGADGGIARYNRDLMTALAAWGATVTVLPRHAGAVSPLPDGVVQLGARPGRWAWTLTAVLEARRLRPDVIFCGHLFSAPLGALIARALRKPLWVQAHPFRVYKFRTMTSGHDATGAHLSDAQRTTRLGRFLRASRFDELPQLVQVLVGEMSFVGPRPLLPRDQPEGSEARLLVRPGLTGWAQINGGRSVAAPDKVALDIWYVRHASLWLDVTIVLRTLLFVLRGEPTDRAETASRPPLTGVKPISAGRPVSGAMAGPEPAPALVRGAPARRPSSLL